MIFDEDFPRMLEKLPGIKFDVVPEAIVHPGRKAFGVRSVARPWRQVRFVGCSNNERIYHVIVPVTMSHDGNVPDVSLLGVPMIEFCGLPNPRSALTLEMYPAKLGDFLRMLR